MVEMFVYRVALDIEQGTAVVLLSDAPVQRLLPIWIRIFEAQAIAMELHGETPPRPYTHDLMASLIKALHWELDRVTITDLRDTTFYALLTLRQGDKVVEVDARPSDGIALALRCDTHIYVAEEVLAQAEIKPSVVTGEGEARDEKEEIETFRQLMRGVRIRSEDGEASGPPPEQPPSPEQEGDQEPSP